MIVILKDAATSDLLEELRRRGLLKTLEAALRIDNFMIAAQYEAESRVTKVEGDLDAYVRGQMTRDIATALNDNGAVSFSVEPGEPYTTYRMRLNCIVEEDEE